MHHQSTLLTWPDPFSCPNIKEKSGLACDTRPTTCRKIVVDILFSGQDAFIYGEFKLMIWGIQMRCQTSGCLLWNLVSPLLSQQFGSFKQLKSCTICSFDPPGTQHLVTAAWHSGTLSSETLTFVLTNWIHWKATWRAGYITVVYW